MNEGEVMKKRFVVFMVIFILVNTVTVYANSAEPPTITVLIEEGPDDLELVFITEHDEIYARASRRGSTRYFYLGFHEITKDPVTSMKFISQEGTFEKTFDNPLDYNTLFRLDFDKQSLKRGKGLLRSIKLISIRLVLTLLIEGCVFYLFAFREDESVMAFILINLVTQGLLNLWINTVQPGDLSHVVMILIISELLIIVAEIIAFNKYIDEHSSLRTTLYVVTANMASLFLGFMIIPKLLI